MQVIMLEALSPNKFNRISASYCSEPFLLKDHSKEEKKKLHPSGHIGIFTVKV